MIVFPVLFITWKRSNTTIENIDLLVKNGFTDFYIYSDGFKDSVESTSVKAVLNARDSFCNLHVKYPNINFLFNYRLNRCCRDSVETAIDWFFKTVNLGLMEDDVLLTQQSIDFLDLIFVISLIQLYILNYCLLSIFI